MAPGFGDLGLKGLVSAVRMWSLASAWASDYAGGDRTSALYSPETSVPVLSMKEERANSILDLIESFFPGSISQDVLKSPFGKQLRSRLERIDREPLTVTQFNQYLHLLHEAGIDPGFFRYYFLESPASHPYVLDTILADQPLLDEKGISTPRQFEWGVRRFVTDALLFFGNARTAYRTLRKMSYKQLTGFFEKKRQDSQGLRSRGETLPFRSIPVDDRYLVSEVACKAYAPVAEGDQSEFEAALIENYRTHGVGRRIRIADLLIPATSDATTPGTQQLMMSFAAQEILDEEVCSEEEIQEQVRPLAGRFRDAREAALANTQLYLSIVNELDIYVATSMRNREDFREMARDCEFIFGQEHLARFRLRYFDPTLSAADGHHDKGLVECLMVKCAKALLYFAGNKDSFGKDAEVAMALSLGKPVIILCPPGEAGGKRMQFFRDIHPLSRLINFSNGVACGAMVTQSREDAAQILSRVFSNSMEYDACRGDRGEFLLRERLTQSVVRLQSGSLLLRESFWNYYKGEQ